MLEFSHRYGTIGDCAEVTGFGKIRGGYCVHDVQVSGQLLVVHGLDPVELFLPPFNEFDTVGPSLYGGVAIKLTEHE
jgi:hypothetical protein